MRSKVPGWLRFGACVHVVMLLLVCLCFTMLTSSCRTGTSKTLAQTDVQARLDSVSADVRKLALMNKSPIIPDIPSMTPEKGATGAACMGVLAKNPDGTPVIINNKPVYEGAWAIGTETTPREFSGFADAHLVLGGWVVGSKDGVDNSEAIGLSGLDVKLKGSNVSSTMNTDLATVWAGASAKQKEAGAEALVKYYEGRKGLAETIITATGQQVTGIVKEVYAATPVGGALAAVKVLADVAGKPTEGTVVTTYKTNPDGTPVKTE